MNAWLQLVRDLFLFRRETSDVPFSPGMLVLLVAATTLIDIAAQPLRSLPSQPGASLIHVVIGLALLNALLALHRRRARFVQTATAGLLVHVPLALLTLGLLHLVGPIPAQLTPENFRPEFAILIATLPLTIWYVVVRTRILAQALEVAPLRAFGLLTLMFVAQVLLTAPFVKIPE